MNATKANQEITWSVTAPIAHGASLSGVLNASSSGEGAISYKEGTTTVTSASVLGAGTHNLIATAAATDNYNEATKPVSLTVTPASLTASFTAADKQYDGNTTAEITGRSVTGKVGSDDVGITGGSGTFADKNVGTGKTVTATGFTLSGTAKDNYVLAAGPFTTTASITAKALTGSITATNKVYDGNATASAQGSLGDGVLGGDVVTLEVSNASFSDKNVGNGKTVTASLSLTGVGAGNYTVNTTANTTANITPKAVSVGSVTVNDKEYDGTTAATITGRTLATGGVIGTDQVSLSGGTAAFADKNVGTGKTVSITGLSLDGTDGGNYSLSAATASTTASITAKAITGSFTADNKGYDGTTAATVATRSLNDAISSDAVSLSGGTATFGDKDVGTGKTVTLAGANLSGADASNYSLSSVGTTTAAITQKELTGSFTAATKVYDGSTAAAVTGTPALTGVFGGDVVSLSITGATFDNANVGTGKIVTATAPILSGAQAGNYKLAAAAITTTADITAKAITGSFTAANKVYDGSTVATITGTPALVGVFGGDVVNLSITGATFADKNVGTGKIVTATSPSLSGAAAGSYSLSSVATTTADITAKAITGSFTAADKEYDGNVAATIATRSLTDVISGDNVSRSGGSASFADKNVGTSKTVTATGFALDGTDKGNYTLGAATASATASITAKTITGSSITAQSKVYDGSRAATATGTLGAGVISGETVELAVSNAQFDTKNVGTGKTVTADLALTGTGAGNYVLGAATAATAATTANITPATVMGSITAANKEYDGNANATIATRLISGGVIGSEDVTLTGGTATFADKNVDTGKTVTGIGFELGGTGASNYTLGTVATATADITARALAVTATAQSKVYDGSTNATVQLSDNRVSGDVLIRANTSATFADANVGPGKTVTVSGISISSTDAGNYTANASTTATADITTRPITVTADAQSKQFGAADPALTYQIASGSLVVGESFSGSLSRVGVGTSAGELVGTYAIQQGTLTAGTNYALTYNPASLTIGKLGLVVNSVSAPVAPRQLGTAEASVTATASFNNTGLSGTAYSATWNWGNGPGTTPGTVSLANGSYQVSGTHTYTAAGVYRVTVTVIETAPGGETKAQMFEYVVVYDPSGGFVTGGGWIDSPAGAYRANPSLTGKANFGFVAKYQRGANVPTGNTEFQFKAGDLNFKSTNYQWLVVSGSKGQFKGTGTINGTGSYNFLLTAIDGSPDKFRIKITDGDTVIYDNQPGATEDSDATTALGGGSIQIQSK